MEFDISFTRKEITPCAGMVYLKTMLQNVGFRELIENNLNLPVSGSIRGYKTPVIVESFFTCIGCGVNRFLHTEVTRHDAVPGKIFDWAHTPGQDTSKCLFSEFAQSTNQEVSG